MLRHLPLLPPNQLLPERAGGVLEGSHYFYVLLSDRLGESNYLAVLVGLGVLQFLEDGHLLVGVELIGAGPDSGDEDEWGVLRMWLRGEVAGLRGPHTRANYNYFNSPGRDQAIIARLHSSYA